MKQTKFIAISSQKGGVGKSTLTVITASILSYLRHKKVAVIDADFPQQFIYNLRDTELKTIKDDPIRAEAFVRQQLHPYPIHSAVVSKDNNAFSSICQQLDGNTDVVFVDLPGTMRLDGISGVWRKMDYIFVPIEPDAESLKSAIGYISVLEDQILNKPDSRLKNYFVIWNKYRKGEKQEIYNQVEAFFLKKHIPLLPVKIEDSVYFRRKDLRSTLLPLQKNMMHSHVVEFAAHIEDIISKRSEEIIDNRLP
ncbi:ParA family protein [Rhodocytophaga aerolata]|uniref:ParA family protein n=1 Tax=Rhodocytophaga aerolata TaxID=455078 RepID=A0ABT8RFJ7_9BACT|nr:ParA family protein [Rhodocytophaga aerolata]MDO1450754.1 ParA family protein [Rhodocytophaga aerolata]